MSGLHPIGTDGAKSIFGSISSGPRRVSCIRARILFSVSTESTISLTVCP